MQLVYVREPFPSWPLATFGGGCQCASPVRGDGDDMVPSAPESVQDIHSHLINVALRVLIASIIIAQVVARPPHTRGDVSGFT